MQQLKLNKFNPMTLEIKRRDGHAPVIVFLGCRGSGKSTLLSDIMWYMKKIPVIVAMSGTEEGNGYYSKHIHELCIYNKFEPDVLEKILIRQKKIVNELTKRGENPKKHAELGVGILMDDLAYDKKMMKDDNIRQIFFNGRHFHVTSSVCIRMMKTYFITFQYMMELAPAFRTNVDYVFVCKETRKDNLKRLYDYFFSMFDSYDDFKKVFNVCTNDYGCIVVDNTCKTGRIEDSVFWYKAKLDRSFKIGTPEMWRDWTRQLKDKDDDDDDDKKDSLVSNQ